MGIYLLEWVCYTGCTAEKTKEDIALHILFVNACVRGEQSNTLKLCRLALEEMKKDYPEATFEEVDLAKDRPLPHYAEDVEESNAQRYAKNWAHPMFDYARQFARADKIVVGAPYWEMAFPSVLRVYLELISVVDIAFAYGEHGPVGLCRADELRYITTSGGPVFAGMNMGFDYIKGLCQGFYGIDDVKCFMVNNLDVVENDPVALMEQGKEDLLAWMHEA